jgi:hypothetical protein
MKNSALCHIALISTCAGICFAGRVAYAAWPPNTVGYDMIGLANDGSLIEAQQRQGGIFGRAVDLSKESALPFVPIGLASSVVPSARTEEAELHLFAWNQTQKLYAVRDLNGYWLGWQPLPSAAGDPGPIRKAVMCADPDQVRYNGTVHVVVLTVANALLHSLRYPDGTWQNGWDDVRGRAGNPGTIVDVACVADPSEPLGIHAGVVTSDGSIWRTLRSSRDSGWQTFEDVTQKAGYRGTFSRLAMAWDGGLEIMGANLDGGIFFTIRSASSPFTWQPFQDVLAQTGPMEPGEVLELSASGPVWSILKASGAPYVTARMSYGQWGQGVWGRIYDVRSHIGTSLPFAGWRLHYYW